MSGLYFNNNLCIIGLIFNYIIQQVSINIKEVKTMLFFKTKTPLNRF